MEKRKENKMGTMPINKLIINMSLPIMISMLIQACYNIVDSKFVSEISENALTAVSLAFPVQNLMISVAAGTGVGINSLMSRSLGAGDGKRAQQTACNGLFLAAMSSLVFVILGMTASGIFYRSQTDVMEIINYGEQYLSICCNLSFGLFMGITFERILQATGKTLFTMITQGTGAIINIILDPILIFGLFGFPKLGVAGAAVATVVGQIIAMFFSMFFSIKMNPEVPLYVKYLRPDSEIIQSIYEVGIPSIIMQSITSVMTYGINRILIQFTTTATAVFGVYYKLNSFIFMPVFGLNNGLVPIMGYNYGAGNKKRIMHTLKSGVIFAMIIMGFGVIVFQIFPNELLQMFNASDIMKDLGRPALRIIALSFIPAAYCIVCGSLFQALGNGFYSMIVSITRQLVVLLPAAWILSLSGRLEYVWWAFPIAEAASICISTFFFRRLYRKKIDVIG